MKRSPDRTFEYWLKQFAIASLIWIAIIATCIATLIVTG